MDNKDAAIAANFERIVLILDCLGPAYEPRQKAVGVTELEEKLEEACAVFCDFDDARRDETTKLTEFDQAMTALTEFLPAIRRVAEASFDHDAFSRDLETIIGRFNSQVAVVGAVSEPFTGRTSAQRIRDSRISCLSDLLSLLRFKARLEPAERETTLNEIESRLALLRFRNDCARSAEAALENARRARERVLDDLPKLVALIKLELARQPGRDSAAYHQVNVLSTRRF